MPTRVISQNIDLTYPQDPVSKYITAIDNNGIKVHATNNINLNYIQITSSGMEVFKTDGITSNPSAISVANFGEIVRIGKEDSAHINITSGGLDLYNGTTQASHLIASFGASGAIIGKIDGAHSVIDVNGQRFYASNGTTQLANIGYGEGMSQSGIATNPYYTFGTRVPYAYDYENSTYYHFGDLCFYDNKIYVSTYRTQTRGEWTSSYWKLITATSENNNVISVGNYSTSHGVDIVASGYVSHAEGSGTKASGIGSHAEGKDSAATSLASHAEGLSIASSSYAHAEGYYTIAEGYSSHAEGYSTTASNQGAHAEGYYTVASGMYSHAGGYYTIANDMNQTVIGKFNDNQSNTAFEIGNGFDISRRSNALTVDWDGTLWTHTIEIQKSTAATNTYADANPKLKFLNETGNQNISLTFTDYDSVQSPASLTLNGNQGGEYFIAPNIKATTSFYGALSGNASTATKATQDGSGNTITSTYLKKTGADTMAGALTISSGGMNVTGNINLKPTSDAANTGSYIQCYNNGTSNYGCLGFMARSTVSGKPAYFAFWTQSPGTNSGSQTGRFYITETSVYTSSSTPFTSAGKLTVSSGGAAITGAVTMSSTLTTTGDITSNGKGTFVGTGTTTSAANARVGTTSPIGRLMYNASSSRRYKHDIEDLNSEQLNPKHLYDIKLKQFKYNSSYLDEGDERSETNVPGFIAEEIYEIYPIAVDLDDEGLPQDWNDRYIIPPMLALIQEQHKEIEQLKKEVAQLKNK